MKTDPEKVAIVPWRTVSIVSLVLNGATIAALATLAGLQNADALATVALALAVVAFVSQLMIFAWQTYQNGVQLTQARELNSSTLQLVADAKTRIDGTYDMVRGQYQELLQLTALKAGAEAAKDSVEHEDKPADKGAPAASTVPSEAVSSAPVTQVPLMKVVARVAITPELRAAFDWPLTEEELEERVAAVEALDEDEQFLLAITVSDYLHSRFEGVSPGLKYLDSDEGLLKLGWTEEVTPRPDESGILRRQVALSESGAKYGALFVAPWPPPPGLDSAKDRIWKLRMIAEAAIQRRLAEASVTLFPPSS
jgi:hypothetical protein